MTPSTGTLLPLMEQAVADCVAHVEAGGLPFVGVLVDNAGTPITGAGVNQVHHSGDPTAHAEVVAIREALAARPSLAGTVLVATGEPCGLCYRFAIDHHVEAIFVAVDRDDVARLGFDYRPSYAAFGITDGTRAALFRPLPVDTGADPFTRFLQLNTPTRLPVRRRTPQKGIPS
ncbi:nucleoside deaminase [Ornithinimicrobium panacihumi]|uniref:nucleoside deaminase n=1 Tax=Ornithinimicrobium panacihumi TaxID=2008449 RepID=UPI003F8898D7